MAKSGSNDSFHQQANSFSRGAAALFALIAVGIVGAGLNSAFLPIIQVAVVAACALGIAACFLLPKRAGELDSYIRGRLAELSGEVAGSSELTLEQSFARLKIKQREAENKQANIIENAVDVICTIDAGNAFLSLNASSLPVLGYLPQELLGKAFTEYLVEEDVEKSLTAVVGMSKSMDRFSIENRWRHKNGKIRDLLWSAHWSSDANTLFCVVHDITERKTAERLLRETEAQQRTILEGLPVAVLLTAENGVIAYANPAVKTITGYDPADLIGETADLLFSNPGTSHLRTGKHEDAIETHFARRSGEVIPVQVLLSNITGGRLNTSRLVVFSDISERHKVEQVKREMLAMVTHELRTPLASIKAVLGLVAEDAYGTLNERGHVMIEKTQAEISRLVRLTQDLLDLEKLSGGNFELIMQDVDLTTLVDAAVEAVRPLADARKIEVEWTPSEVVVHGDGARIIQVLINLLGNSIKFSPDGAKVKVAIEYPNDGFVKVAVVDKGRGIPAEHSVKVFEKFYQVQKEDRLRGGVGLGLPICREIIERHGGHIGVNSSLGKGSEFWFTLPKGIVGDSNG